MSIENCPYRKKQREAKKLCQPKWLHVNVGRRPYNVGNNEAKRKKRLQQGQWATKYGAKVKLGDDGLIRKRQPGED